MRSSERILACALLGLFFVATSGANAEPQEKKPSASASAANGPTTAAAPSNADSVKAPDHGDTNIWLIVLSSSVISGVLGALISGWINLAEQEAVEHLHTIAKAGKTVRDNIQSRHLNLHMNRPDNTNSRDPEAEVRCVARYREHLGRMIGCALKILPTVKFDKHDPQHLAAICEDSHQGPRVNRRSRRWQIIEASALRALRWESSTCTFRNSDLMECGGPYRLTNT